MLIGFLTIVSLFLAASCASDLTDDHGDKMEMILGGLTQAKPADEKIQNMVDQVRPSFEGKQEDGPSSEFTAVSYSQQLVNGINYFVKVKAGETEYVHLKIYQPFGSEDYTLVTYQDDKTLEDPIEYF